MIRDIWCFRHRPPDDLGVVSDAWIDDAPPPPEYLVLGPGAFKDIPHADGIGSWNASELIFECDANGGLTSSIGPTASGRGGASSISRRCCR